MARKTEGGGEREAESEGEKDRQTEMDRDREIGIDRSDEGEAERDRLKPRELAGFKVKSITMLALMVYEQKIIILYSPL